ncbi:energy-coupled thiamine transporter ThiT [Clostridiaceae bacterium M8S5]|nr:energy-coupled thiamine transporter ThiT [Clostridiaceae bacterium M8S5]
MIKQFLDAVNSGNITEIMASTLGQILTAIIGIILLIAALAIGSKNKKIKTKELVYCALAIAIAMVLSQIKIVELPQGGAITPFSMLFVVLIGYWFGVKTGIMCGVAYGLFKLSIGGYVVHPLQMLLDYPLAFGALGLAGIFSNSSNGLMKGLIIGAGGRFVFHFITGVVYFASYAKDFGFATVPYSFGYNLSYIAGEVFLTIIILIIPAVDKAMNQVKKGASA